MKTLQSVYYGKQKPGEIVWNINQTLHYKQNVQGF